MRPAVFCARGEGLKGAKTGGGEEQKKIRPKTNFPLPKLTSYHQFLSWPGNSLQGADPTGNSRRQPAKMNETHSAPEFMVSYC